MKTKYLFDDLDILVNHIFYKYKKDKGEEITQLQLHKTLYLLYCYYISFYNSYQSQDKTSEGPIQFPELLFPGEFEAWTSGPVINELYLKMKFNNDYKGEEWVPKSSLLNEFKEEYIDDIINQTISASDFSLVDRVHQDNCFNNHYDKDNRDNVIPINEIIKEYTNK